MIRLIQCLFCFVLVSSFLPHGANAHEVNPAYLELQEISEQRFAVTWKQPLKDGKRLRLQPVFPTDCTQSDPSLRLAGPAIVESAQLRCDLRQGELRIDGLQRTLTDVFVRIVYEDGETVSVLLRPSSTSISLEQPRSGAPLMAYFSLGVEHIIFGYDHLLFVLGLCLLVSARNLFQTITAFTVAHSITLALATLGNITLPGPPVEAVIAVSLILLAREALTSMAGGQTLTARIPWLVAFGFGLIHGFGFAGALSDIGLPQNQEAWALLLFNLGVEIGQIAFVLCVFAVSWLAVMANRSSERVMRTAAAYSVGVAGTYWAIERMLSF